jgi:hypothetical protein
VIAKLLSLVAVGVLLIAAARFVDSPNEAQADSVPEQYRETVQKGLEFLDRHQFEDGHWEEAGGAHPVEMTGLVGLAFHMESRVGRTRIKRRRAGDEHAAHEVNTRKAVDWLIARSQANRDGLIFSEHASETSRYMHGHGFATLFLAGVCENERDDERRRQVEQVVARAVKYIVNSQSSQGGWYDTSKLEGHDFATIRATVIQLQALQAAENAGVPVPAAALRDAAEYLWTPLHKLEESNQRELDDLPAILAGLRLGRVASRSPLTQKLFERCRSKVPVGTDIKFGRDELIHYYFSQAEHEISDQWTKYSAALFEHLKNTRNKDGSWSVGDDTRVDRVYVAAVWCTILQLDNGHPSRPQLDEIVK